MDGALRGLAGSVAAPGRALLRDDAGYLCSDETPQRWGNAHASIVPFRRSWRRTYLVLTIGNDGQWHRFCEAAGVGESGQRMPALRPIRSAWRTGTR